MQTQKLPGIILFDGLAIHPVESIKGLPILTPALKMLMFTTFFFEPKTDENNALFNDKKRV